MSCMYGRTSTLAPMGNGGEKGPWHSRYSTSSMLCTSRFLPAVDPRSVTRSLPRRVEDKMNVHVISRMRDSISFPFQDHSRERERVCVCVGCGRRVRRMDGWMDGVEGVVFHAGRRKL